MHFYKRRAIVESGGFGPCQAFRDLVVSQNETPKLISGTHADARVA